MPEILAPGGRIPVAGPWITSREIEYVTDAVTNAWYDNANVYHERFEKAFSSYVDRKYAICLPSCTSALHLSLLALGVGPGDEVIVPDVTWIASAAPVSYVGAVPVFADIDPSSWCLSVESVAANITRRTKAIIAVDLHGNMPDMDALLRLSASRGIPVIEDAAEAIGSECGGRKAGSFGETSTFSFHGSKTLTTGEGGMLVTNDQRIYERCLFLRDHGRRPGDTLFWNAEVAFKYKMSSMQAALGLAQLERIEELVDQKRLTFSWYREALADVVGVTLNAQPTGTKNSYWMVTALLDPDLGVSRADLMSRLREKGVDTRPFFHPLSSIPAYVDRPSARAARSRNANSYCLAPRGINLPSGFDMTRERVEYVARHVRTASHA
ncbi:MAG: DegT/DnrJ/EryC1/StrS family aminotransferase [Dehalococcoidia bacterium]